MSSRNWSLSFLGSLFGLYLLVFMWAGVEASLKYDVDHARPATVIYRGDDTIIVADLEESLNADADLLEIGIGVAVLTVLILLVQGMRVQDETGEESDPRALHH
jgi:hypothetical protein